jgi:hypothetical protein
VIDTNFRRFIFFSRLGAFDSARWKGFVPERTLPNARVTGMCAGLSPEHRVAPIWQSPLQITGNTGGSRRC